MSSPDEIQGWLAAGIAALKAGEHELARDWLTRVVEVDRENERAWLWLSGALEDPTERRLCLENVLVLNPANEAAQRGLRLLAEAPAAPLPDPAAGERGEIQTADMEEIHVRREVTAPSPASAMLYPERQVKEWRYRQKPLDVRSIPLGMASESSFDDVWVGKAPLCAYCAAAVPDDARRCPKCRRKLTYRQFRYATPSGSMFVLAVMLFSLGQLFLVQGLYGLLTGRTMAQVIVLGVVAGWTMLLAGAVYFRRPRAHTVSLATLLIILVLLLLQPIAPFEMALLQIPGLDPAIAAVARPIPGAVARALRLFQIAAAGISLVYAIWATAPDFDRVERRRIAAVRTGLTAADQYDAAAKRLAGSGLWAAAIVHWQRAVALEPLRVQYQRALALAYSRLGFYERALDMLDTSLRLAGSSEVRQELEAMRATIEKKAEQTTA